ncbi:MAG: hypothetical protein H7067_09025 [Burkholderiales bacterium]|nr:hypothetical protein [Opitutaceae bacterium]
MPSKIIEDLHNVANIVGGLGISIAEAQRKLNLDYLEAVERLSVIAIALQKKQPATRAGAAAGTVENLPAADAAFVCDFLSKFAPTRYQYTETTLKVRLDLAQTLSVAGSAGLGVNVGAVAVNASFAASYGSQYQAAAEVSTVLHAVKADVDAAFLSGLGTRAAAVNDAKLTLPARAYEIDRATIETSGRIINKLLGIETPKITPEPANSGN